MSPRNEIGFTAAIAMVGAAILISSGWGLWEISDKIQKIKAPEQPHCYQDVIINKKREHRRRHLFLTDQAGRRLDVCSGNECAYSGWGVDVGRRTRMCYSGPVLVSVEVEGISRLTHAERLDDLRDRSWLHVQMLAVGVLCVALYAYHECKRRFRVTS